jgi:hypothetical protein
MTGCLAIPGPQEVGKVVHADQRSGSGVLKGAFRTCEVS